MSCRSDNILSYLADRLSPQDETALERHLEACECCRRTMAEAAGSDADWESISTALRCDELDDDAPLRAAPAWPLTLLGPTDDPRMLGRIGPFEVSGCVGVGGMGVVFKARDPALDRFVAVKVLSPQLAASETARTRFAREAKAAAAVVHDNVIAVHQVAEYRGLPYLVMPYLPGPSLEDRLRIHGPMSPVEVLRVARQVADGLQAAHDQGLIHRDIKPANILLSGETERAVITDFGLARAADDATLTRSGALAGTPQFMAPEQARGEPTDARSDLFSLGALMFAMLTGRPPVAELSGSETVRKVGHQPPPKLSTVMLDVPRWLAVLVESLHAFDSQRRLPSAAVAGREILNAMPNASSAPLKRRDSVAESENRSARRTALRRGFWRIGFVAAAGLTAVAAILFQGDADERGVEVNRTSPTEFSAASATPIAQAPISHAPNTAVTEPTPSETLPAESRPAEAVVRSRGSHRSRTEFDSVLSDTDGRQLDLLLNEIDRKLEVLENR